VHADAILGRQGSAQGASGHPRLMSMGRYPRESVVLVVVVVLVTDEGRDIFIRMFRAIRKYKEC
jgi:hypothetical protein